jgi:nucleoside-diphosphate-sugar epimerase
LQKRRFVVTGGSGFVGQFLIKKLSSLYPDSEIHNIDIHHPIGLDFSNVSNHIIDLTDQQSLKSFKFSENDIVYHLAAYIFTDHVPSKAKREGWFESLNVYGTQNLLAAMEENGAKKYCLHFNGYGLWLTTDESHRDKPSIKSKWTLWS